MKPIILTIGLGAIIAYHLITIINTQKSVDYGVLVSHGNIPMKTSSGETIKCIMIRNNLSCYYPEEN